jgi:hypothetical protein
MGAVPFLATWEIAVYRIAESESALVIIVEEFEATAWE